MVLRLIISSLIGLALIFFGSLLYKSFQSQNIKPKVGVVDGKLQACSEKPNCVSSFSPPEDKDHYYPPLTGEPIEALWDQLEKTIKEMGLQIVTIDGQYIHATDTTKIMRYVDDVEFLLSETNKEIYVRSASRVGYSDMGANRKRIDKIKEKVFNSSTN